MYTYEETPETMDFWERILRKLYGRQYKEVKWSPVNSYADVKLKQDLAMITISDTEHYYQVKTVHSRRKTNNAIFFNINVGQAWDYYNNNYPIDVIAFGSPYFGVAILFKYEDFNLFWKRLSKRSNGKEYVRFSIRDIAVYNIHHKYIEVESNIPF